MCVGLLADDEAEVENESAGELRADFAVVRQVLAEAGAAPWDEPELDEQDVRWFDMVGYSGLHTLRRLAVHLAEHGSLPEPLGDTGPASRDPLLLDAYADMPGSPPGPFDHLVHHSDCEGYYVPVPFDEVIVDQRLAGGHLGSSVRLLDEVRRIAAALELPADLDLEAEDVFDAVDAETPAAEVWRRHGVESYTCLQLISAAEHSIATGAALVFC
ncbi:hypothetical protein GCM10010182_15000 [Actinomadura cremea]|nr:hypothetical protein GCM10010182_15000 [Actinomadura cremea]